MQSHHIERLDVEYGTLVPLHYMDPERELRVVSVAAWCPWHDLDDSRVVGEAVRPAIEACDERVAILATGSLSHRIPDNRVGSDGMFTISAELYRQVEHRVVELWQAGRFASSGTGQVNAVLPGP